LEAQKMWRISWLVDWLIAYRRQWRLELTGEKVRVFRVTVRSAYFREIRRMATNISAQLPYLIQKLNSTYEITMLCVCVPPAPSSTFECLSQSLTKLGMYTIGTWAHLNGVLHKSLHLSLPLPLSLLANRSVRNVTAASNTHVIEKVLDASFSMRSVTYQRKVGDYFSPHVVFYLCKCCPRLTSSCRPRHSSGG
jgi:hypothetical protein